MASPPFRDSTCGHFLGALLLSYGLFNTYLFFKFTPVYTATSCGDQTGLLKQLEVGESIHVGLEISVVCSNPNPYAVKILNDTPGHVFVGKDRGADVGVLTLLGGSTLPAEGQGEIKVFMDSHIAKESSGALAEKFLGNGEIPIFLELKFNVGVDIRFGLQHFGTTAPFDKKCGMNIGGLFDRSANKLGPMVCRSSFDELTELPHLGEAPPGAMSFSAAQMAPDRVRMGERLKNVGILGAGSLSYFLGLFLTYSFFQQSLQAGLQAGPTLLRTSSRALSREGFGDSCRRVKSGNSQEQRQHKWLFWRSPDPSRADASASRRGQLRSTDEHSRLMSLLSCGLLAWPRAKSDQPSLARRSESQASGELSGLHPNCARCAV
mmetsp:Transcript_2925/g.7013  ORF Transcript_2925/g.7013 Transcript_2925/m.7013 type:complete len:378 (+) Transcript_2925:33-1166(+)